MFVISLSECSGIQAVETAFMYEEWLSYAGALEGVPHFSRDPSYLKQGVYDNVNCCVHSFSKFEPWYKLLFLDLSKWYYGGFTHIEWGTGYRLIFFPVLITPCFYHNTNQLSFFIFPSYLAPHRLLVSASLFTVASKKYYFLPTHRRNALFGVQNVFPWGVWAEVFSPREKYRIRFFIL